MKILVIGGGNMGMTYAQSFIASHITSKEDMMILEKSPQKAEMLAKKDIGTVYSSAANCIKLADLVIFAVKPQDCSKLFADLRPVIDSQQVFLSIMAGVKIQTIVDELGAKKIIRAMPNLPAQIGGGMTTFTSTDDVTRIELVMVQNLLSTTGKSIYVETEQAIDATTAISGSGPAYVWFFMNSLMTAAREMGFSEAHAELLVVQTFGGAINLFRKSNLSCDEWIKRVASKGGTTEAALASFQETKLAKSIMDGAKAALDRAVELGKK